MFFVLCNSLSSPRETHVSRTHQTSVPSRQPSAQLSSSQRACPETDAELQVESIGDGYMISAGCPLTTDCNVARAAETALDMISAMSTVRAPRVVLSGYRCCVGTYGIAYRRELVPALRTRRDLSHVDRMQSSPLLHRPSHTAPPSALPDRSRFPRAPEAYPARESPLPCDVQPCATPSLANGGAC